MKKRRLKILAATTGLVTVSVMAAVTLSTATPQKGVLDSLAGVSALEMPQVAAKIVSQTPMAQKGAVAREVVQKAAVLSQPGLTPFMVSAICRSTPSVASDVVSAAVSIRPAETLAIAKAALNAAPDQTDVIVAAVCKQVPESYGAVATVAAEANPAARDQILKAVVSALPVLAPEVARAQNYYVNGSMAEVMQKTHELAMSAYKEKVAKAKRAALEQNTVQESEIARTSAHPSELAYLSHGENNQNANGIQNPPPTTQGPPRVGLPFTPGTGSSADFNANQGTVIQPGAPRTRDYSSP